MLIQKTWISLFEKKLGFKEIQLSPRLDFSGTWPGLWARNSWTCCFLSPGCIHTVINPRNRGTWVQLVSISILLLLAVELIKCQFQWVCSMFGKLPVSRKLKSIHILIWIQFGQEFFFPVNLETVFSCQLESQLCHSLCDALSLINMNEKSVLL